MYQWMYQSMYQSSIVHVLMIKKYQIILIWNKLLGQHYNEANVHNRKMSTDPNPYNTFIVIVKTICTALITEFI